MIRYSTRAAMLIVAGLLGTTAAHAQAWPQRSITFMVPFAAGGGTDAFARPLAAQLDQQLGQRIIIENRGGAGGTTGASQASKATPDGYTWFIGAAHHTIAPHLYPKLDYSIETDFVPVALLARPPQVLVVNPKVQAKSVAELIALAKANPGKLNFGSAGVGTTHQLAAELFKTQTGTNMSHVPYRGIGPAMADLVSGHIEMIFDGLGSSSSQISGGSIRALAVASEKRSPAFPDVPTMIEAGVPGYVVSTWYAIWAVKGTPQPIIDKMTAEVRKALAGEALQKTWAQNGSDVPDVTGAEFGKFVSSEVLRWGKVVKDSGVKLD